MTKKKEFCKKCGHREGKENDWVISINRRACPYSHINTEDVRKPLECGLFDSGGKTVYCCYEDCPKRIKEGEV